MSSTVSFEEVKCFLADGYETGTLFGVMKDNWADDRVTVDYTLANPVVTKRHVENFYNSFGCTEKSQNITGEKNIIIFQCDSRAPGTVKSNDLELEKSFMLFHNYVKYRGQSLGYYFLFDAKEFEAVGVFWTKALCLYLLHILLPHFKTPIRTSSMSHNCAVSHAKVCCKISAI